VQALNDLIEAPKTIAPRRQREEINSGWHIVLCVPNRELTAVAGLTERRFEASCPCLYGRRRTGKIDANGRPVLSNEPSPKAMIPGYCFVKFENGRDPDYDGVKAVAGVRGFYKLVTADPDKPKYAGLRDAELDDLRLADRLALERFQESVMPKSKRAPTVAFKQGQPVKFTTKFGKEIYGVMEQKKGGGMVRVLTDNAFYIVPHFDLALASCE
jgi:hypothetical protein